MVLWELLLVIIDPEQVEDLIAGACRDVSFENCHVRLPQHMHQICTTTLAFVASSTTCLPDLEKTKRDKLERSPDQQRSQAFAQTC